MELLDRVISRLNRLRVEGQYRRIKRKYLDPHYTNADSPAVNDRKMVVYMADGVIYQGGIADRLRGILTLYDYCKEHDLDFRINFTHPFPLEDYLIPGEYDWRLKPGELSKNSDTSMAINLYTPHHGRGVRTESFMRSMYDKYIMQPYKQIHVYTIYDYAAPRYNQLFAELFRFSPELQKRMDAVKTQLGSDYISVSTRFLELLGDFEEPRPMVKPLAAGDRELLIQRCIDELERLHELQNKNIFVTSDSRTFLQRVSGLPYVKVVEGPVSHVSVEKDGRSESDMKTFVDFFGIAGASHSYLLRTGEMYHSGFSRRAAQISGHPFTDIEF